MEASGTDPNFDYMALFRRLEGCWNTWIDDRYHFVEFTYRGGKRAQFCPAAARLTGFVVAAADEQQIAVAAERVAVLTFIQVHAVQRRRALQRDDITAVLVDLHEIQPQDVDHGVVRGQHDMLRRDRPVCCMGGQALKLADECVLVDRQPVSEGNQQLERMKLRLAFHREDPDGVQGQGRALLNARKQAEPVVGLGLALELAPGVRSVDIGCLGLKIAGVLLVQCMKPRNRFGVRFIILPGFFEAEAFDQSA